MDRRTAKWLSLLLAFFLASTSFGEVRRKVGKHNRLYELHTEKRCAFIVMAPLGLDVRSFVLEDGKQVLVFWSGPHKQIVLTTFSNGEIVPDVIQYVIDFSGPNPNPNPEPEPDKLTGFALEVFQYVSKLSLDQAWRNQVASNFATVASAIAAGGIKTRGEANQRLYELNGVQPRAAEPFFNMVEDYLTEKDIRTPEQMSDTFNAVAEGLRHVAP